MTSAPVLSHSPYPHLPIRNSGASAFHLIIYSTAHRCYSLARIILTHVFHDAGTGNIIAVHIRQLSLQSATWSNEVLMVFHGDDDNQSSSALLVTDAILVAHILCHPEGILVVHLAHDDEHILHATLQLQFLQVEIGRILQRLIYISIRIGNILRRIPEERNRYILCTPLPLPVSDNTLKAILSSKLKNIS